MESPERIKAEYNIIAKKHGLPKWEILDKDLELLNVAPVIEISSPLSFVVNKICERINGRLEYLHAILNPPPTNMILIKEYSFLDDDDRKHITKLMTQMMASLVNAKIIENRSEKNLVDALKHRYKTWEKTRAPYVKIIKKIDDGWKKAVKNY